MSLKNLNQLSFLNQCIFPLSLTLAGTGCLEKLFQIALPIKTGDEELREDTVIFL